MRKIYDWNKWFSRRRFCLRRGKDYTCQQATMGQQIRNAAVRMGVRVSLVESKDQFTVLVERNGNA